MWAQLIKTQVKPGTDVAGLEEKLRAAEQPDSGLLRTLLMRDQKDSSQIYGLVVFESEEKARARERDPRRQEALSEVSAQMADMYVAPPEFTDLDVSDEWTAGPGAGSGATTEHPDAAVVRSAYEALAVRPRGTRPRTPISGPARKAPSAAVDGALRARSALCARSGRSSDDVAQRVPIGS